VPAGCGGETVRAGGAGTTSGRSPGRGAPPPRAPAPPATASGSGLGSWGSWDWCPLAVPGWSSARAAGAMGRGPYPEPSRYPSRTTAAPTIRFTCRVEEARPAWRPDHALGVGGRSPGCRRDASSGRRSSDRTSRAPRAWRRVRPAGRPAAARPHRRWPGSAHPASGGPGKRGL